MASTMTMAGLATGTVASCHRRCIKYALLRRCQLRVKLFDRFDALGHVRPALLHSAKHHVQALRCRQILERLSHGLTGLRCHAGFAGGLGKFLPRGSLTRLQLKFFLQGG